MLYPPPVLPLMQNQIIDKYIIKYYITLPRPGKGQDLGPYVHIGPIYRFHLNGKAPLEGENGEAPPAAEKASRFRGSGAIGGPARDRESLRRDGAAVSEAD